MATSFDVAGVSARADKALVKNQSNPEESRQIYLEEIMDWTDNYTENNLASSFSKEAKDTLSSIVKLWIAYCGMEISLRQFKQAVKIFEDAISDPVVSRSADIYLAYVDYCKTRGKLANAQKVYIKGLSSNLAQEEADKLWSNFLPFIQSQGSPSLTMQQLFEAVTSEAGLGSNLLIPPGPGALVVDTVKVSTIDVNATVEIPIDNTQDNSISNTSHNLDDVESSSPMVLEESYSVAESKTDEPSTTSASVESSIKDPSIGIDRSDVMVKLEKTASPAQAETPADIRIVGDVSSQAIKPEDVKNNVPNHDIEATGLASSDIPTNLGGVGDDLDSVVGMTPEQLTRMYQHRPPMLFSAPNMEPTVFGLSVLSPEETTELELFVGVNLSDIRYGQRQNKVDEYLDLVEGLWTTQALKERHFDSWFTDLKKLHEKEGLDLSKACEEKEKEAVGASLIDSVKEKNQADRKRFRSRCAVQREVLHAVVNKTIYSLLMDQQRALVAAGFPRFSTSIVERIQNTMVALKSSPSSVTATPVTGGRPVSNFDSILLEELSVQKKFVCVLLSLRVNLEPPSSHRFGSGYGRRDSNEGGLMRGSSVGSDYYSGGKNGRSDYYSQDSKLQRKAKRRKVYSADGSEEIRFDDRRMRLDTASSDSRGFEGRRQQQGQSLGYQGPEHLRRGPRRGVRGPMNRNLGCEGGVHNSQNPKGSATFTEKNKSEEAPPINLLQKLATMIQKVKK